MKKLISLILPLLMLSCSSSAQDKAYRPELAFREDWKEIPPKLPVDQDHVNHPDLILALHGPGADSVKKSNHDKPVDDPFYIWSGRCTGTWALSLEHRSAYLDMSSYSRVVWRSKQQGLRQLRLILQVEDGTWLVSKQADGPSGDWRIKEFIVDDLNWFELDIKEVCEKKPVNDPDLSRVVRIGFTDLMKGGGSDACSRLDWIEVYAYLVNR